MIVATGVWLTRTAVHKVHEATVAHKMHSVCLSSLELYLQTWKKYSAAFPKAGMSVKRLCRKRSEMLSISGSAMAKGSMGPFSLTSQLCKHHAVCCNPITCLTGKSNAHLHILTSN